MLAVPSYAFGVVADNWMSATPSTTPGTLLTQVSAVDTKITTVACISTPLAQPGYAIQIGIINTSVSGSDTSALMDIMYDPAGGTAWQVLIPNLICGFLGSSIQSAGHYWFPLYIPRGSSIGARWQCVTDTTVTPSVAITIFGGPSSPGFWYGTKVTDVGTNTTGSAGTDLNPGSTGAWSGWANVGGTSNPSFGFLTCGAQGTATAHTGDFYHVQYGFGSTQIPAAQVRFGYSIAEVIHSYPPHFGVFADIPGGTQLQARATGSDATSEDPSVALYGVS